MSSVCLLQATGEAHSMGLAGRMASADSDDEDEDKLAGSGAAPAFYTADMAKKWVPTAMHANRQEALG